MPKALQALDENIWTLDQPFSLGGLEIGTRSTVIRLNDGSLWIHSPGPETGAAYRSLKTLGEVLHLVAPNAFHHLYLKPAGELFPEAVLWGPGAVQKKQPRLKIQRLGSDSPWAPEIELIAIQGMSSQEYVFFHPSSRSLIVTDLLLHLFPQKQPDKMLFGIAGLSNKLCWDKVVSPFLLKDPKALQKSLQNILNWNFERILMSHGRIVELDARERFKTALEGVMAPAGKA